jgi:predicted PurR-regulated permease PerM
MTGVPPQFPRSADAVLFDGSGGPPLMPRGLVILLGAAAAVVTLAGVRAVAWLIGPAFLALMIVIAVSPVQAWLVRHRFPRWLTTLLVVVLVYALLVALVLVLVVSVAKLATLLPQYADRAKSLVDSVTNSLAEFGVGQGQIKASSGSLDLGRVTQYVGKLLADVGGVLTSVVFLLALLLFLSVEAGGAEDRMAAIAADRPWASNALRQFASGTRSYLLVTTIFGLIVAVLDAGALALLGIPVPILWGLLAFVTNYIPNVGFVLGLVPPALLALLSGGWERMVVVIVIYSLLNFVVQSLIQPRFVGDSVGLSATVTFVALVFWAWLLGPLGALLAIPLTLLAKALLVDIDPRAQWADALVRSPDRPVKPGRPHTRRRGSEKPVRAAGN